MCHKLLTERALLYLSQCKRVSSVSYLLWFVQFVEGFLCTSSLLRCPPIAHVPIELTHSQVLHPPLKGPVPAVIAVDTVSLHVARPDSGPPL